MTLRQETFAQNVANGKSHREAALAAGYSPRSAGCSGSQLVKQPNISARIQELRAAGGLATPRSITPDAILQRLTAGFQSALGR